ncbi:MAG: HAMP domain-containing sensor histidine kinase [Vicinamibacterales bacterium]
MADHVWYRSLYWRIALGFVVLLAALLAAQGFVSLWLTGRVAELIPGRSPAQFAETIASELSVALADAPDLDLESHLRDRYATANQAWVAFLRDGRSATSQRVPPPASALRAARIRLFGLTGQPIPSPEGGGGRGAAGSGAEPVTSDTESSPPATPRTESAAPPTRPPSSSGSPRRGRGDGPGGFGRGEGRGRSGRGSGRGGPLLDFATVTLDGRPFGVIAVPSERPPLSVALRGFAPTLATVGVVLLLLGTTLAALLVFRPAHRRLRALERAARAFGAGDATARATEAGGDEVAALARTFNEMADGLSARSSALIEADRARRQLLADISHELATPLAAIRGYAETLAMPDLALDDATRSRYAGVIHDETERLSAIVGDLLDLARFEGGGASFRPAVVPLRSIVERVASRHDPVLREKRITLDARVEPPDLTVMADAGRLEQALQNLAANAARHTPDGGDIRLHAARDGDIVRITVEDSGPGIPPEHLSRVFDRFYKVDESRTGTRVPSGSGLGLSIVRAIIERHGGTIEASNAPDGGARFEITLPAA